VINLLSPFFLISSVVTLSLGIWVVSLNPKNKIYFSWFLFCLSVGLWSFGLGILTSVQSEKTANVFYFVHYFGAINIPVAFLYFIRVHFLKDAKLRWDLVLGILLAFLQMDLFVTGELCAPLTAKWKFYFYTNPGRFYWLFVAYFFIYVLYSFYLMLRSTISDEASQRKRKIFFITATGLGYIGGSSAFLLVYNINFPPYGIFLFLLFPIITTYAIIKYRFMDIEVIIKRTIIFAGIVTSAVSIIAFPFAIIQAVIGRALGIPDPFVLLALGIATTVLIYRPVERVLVNITDKYLFQKKQEIKVILRNLSEKVVTILDLKQVGQMILSTLVETFRLESGMIVIYDQKAEKYRILENLGILPDDFVQSVRQYFNQSDIHEYFRNHQSIISLDHPESDGLLGNILEWLNIAKGRVCIPLFIDEDQNGFLVLGKKKSDQEFTQEEMDYFPTIESQVSLAIQKARLLETVVEEREAKVKAEHIAERVWFAGTIKHEVKNRLAAGIIGPTNVLRIHHVADLKKAFDEGDREWFQEIFCKIENIITELLNGAQMILDIAETTLGGLEPDQTKFRRNYFKILWNDAKKASGMEELCDFESSIPDGFVIYGNYPVLMRVFENLIINACDAMKGQEEKLIKLRCSYQQIEGKRVSYCELEDHGNGIPEEMQSKIFERGFSTKPKPDDKDLVTSGHGQGLYVCKVNIEKLHGGKIWVESQVGKGTIFKFWVPMEASDTA